MPQTHESPNTYQADAVEAVADCFAGQPKVEGVTYRLDPGKLAARQSFVVKARESEYGRGSIRASVSYDHLR